MRGRDKSSFGGHLRFPSRDDVDAMVPVDNYLEKEEPYEELETPSGYFTWNVMAAVVGIGSLLLVLFTYHEVYGGNRVQAGTVRPSPPSTTDTKPVTSKFTFPPRERMPVMIPAAQAQLPRLLGGGELVGTNMQFVTFDLQTFRGNPFELPLEGDNSRNELINELQSHIYPDSEEKKISSMFTDSTYQELKETLAKSGSLVGNLDNYWKSIREMSFEEFVISPQNLAHIQRLDRQTSPFIGKFGPHMRPTATTCFEQLEVENVPKWFQEQWMKFIFQVEATSPVSGRQGTIYGLTRESQCTGEALVALAVYDTMMMSILSGSGKAGHYHEVRQKQCALLTEGSQKSFLNLLEEGKQNFRQVDVIILRNINAELAEKIRTSEFGRTQFELKVPRSFNKLSNDNPAILLRIGRFLGAQEVIIDAFEDGVEDYGRSFVCSATRLDTSQTLVLLASLSSRKALEVVHDEVILKESSNRMLLAGMAATTVPTNDEVLDRGLREMSPLQSKKNSLRIYDLFATTSAGQRGKLSVTENKEKSSKQHHLLVYQDAEYSVNSDAGLEKLVNIEVGTVKYPFIYKPVAVSLVKKDVTVKQRAAMLGSMLLSIVKSKETPGPTALVEKVKEEKSTDVVSVVENVNKTVGEQQASVPPPVIAEVVVPTVSENGSIKLPPTDVGNFVGLPEGDLFPSHSQGSGDITVTAVCDNGLGDRLGSLYSAITLAHSLKAHFHMIWNVNNECLARFSVLFSFDGTSSAIHNKSHTDNLEMRMKGQEPAFDAIITLKHHFSTGHLVGNAPGSPTPPSDGSQWLCGEARKVPLSLDGDLVKWALARKAYVLYFVLIVLVSVAN